MASLTINVSFLGGTDIEDAVKEAQQLRKKTGANIEFKFNGHQVFICRDDQTPKNIVIKYHEALHSGDLVA